MSRILLILIVANTAFAGRITSQRLGGWIRAQTCENLVVRFGSYRVDPATYYSSDFAKERRWNRRQLQRRALAQIEEELNDRYGNFLERRRALVRHFLFGKPYSYSRAIALFVEPNRRAPFEALSIDTRTGSYIEIATKLEQERDPEITQENLLEIYNREIWRQLHKRRN